MVMAGRPGAHSTATLDSVQVADAKRAQSHQRVLDALAKAGATEDTIRRVKEAHDRSSTGTISSHVHKLGNIRGDIHSLPGVSEYAEDSQRMSDDGRQGDKSRRGDNHSTLFTAYGEHVQPKGVPANRYSEKPNRHSVEPSSGSNRDQQQGESSFEYMSTSGRSWKPTDDWKPPEEGSVGVGAHIERTRTGEHIVVAVKEGGSACTAKIIPGSIIRAVNGFDISGESIINVRDMILGEDGSFVTVSLQPPGAHRSYVEDVVLLRGDTVSADPIVWGQLDSRSQDAAQTESSSLSTRKSGFFSWFLCWGNRKTHTPEDHCDRPSAPPARRESAPAAFPPRLAKLDTIPERHYSAPLPAESSRSCIRAATNNIWQDDEDMEDSIMRVKRQTEQTAALLENLVRGSRAFAEYQDNSLLRASYPSYSSISGVSDQLATSSVQKGRLLSVNNHPVYRDVEEMEAEEEPARLRNSTGDEGKQMLWEYLRDLEFTVNNLGKGEADAEPVHAEPLPAVAPPVPAPKPAEVVEKPMPAEVVEKPMPAEVVEKPMPAEVVEKPMPVVTPVKEPEPDKPVEEFKPAESKETSPPPPPPVPTSFGLSGKNLKVKVLQGRDLQVMDVTGSSDPYCQIILGEQDSKTKVIKHNLEPHWDEDFNFQMNLEGNGPDRLLLKVLDWNMVMKHHLMGEASVKLRDVVVNDTGVSEHMWIDLYRTDEAGKVKSGCVLIELSCDSPVAIYDMLPENWSQHWSKTKNRPYYSNSTTGETRWTKPTA